MYESYKTNCVMKGNKNMENKFVAGIEQEVAWKLTENGLDAFNTTFDSCLDLFSTIGALRTRQDDEIITKFMKAYTEQPLTAMKILFYARDIEEGLGERRVFRICLKWLALNRTNDVIANIYNIAKYGRFDDLYELVDTPAETDMFEFVKVQILSDIKNMSEHQPVSLLTKWLKSVNTSSPESVRLGKLTAKRLNLSEREYRQLLSTMRTYIDVLEKKMSAKEWDKIDFNNVPGGAMKKYVGAFYKHQEERYKEYLDALKTGKKITVVKDDGTVVEKEAKINTKHLYPYEIIEKYMPGELGHIKNVQPELEAMWNGLNDWINGVNVNMIVIADTSGSMEGRPMATSVGLGVYFAERNQGAFHNKFMTFSSKPSWITLKDTMTLADKLHVVPDIVDNTNLEAAFDLILKVGVDNHLTDDDMPKSLVVITDMEFDECVVDNSIISRQWYPLPTKMTFYDNMKDKYNQYGYNLPEIVFWNVSSRQDTFHTQKNTPHVRMVSGQATSVFKTLIDGKKHTPYEFMLEVVYNARYDAVVLG